MSTSKKSIKPSVKVSDLKPAKTAKGGSKVHTNAMTSKTHGTH